MHPRKGFGALLGSGISLIAACMSVLAFASAIVAFRGWPGVAEPLSVAPAYVALGSGGHRPTPRLLVLPVAQRPLTPTAGRPTGAVIGTPARVPNGARARHPRGAPHAAARTPPRSAGGDPPGAPVRATGVESPLDGAVGTVQHTLNPTVTNVATAVRQAAAAVPTVLQQASGAVKDAAPRSLGH